MATREDNKDGSCREILNGKLAGKWRVQYSYRDEFGRNNRISRVFKTKTEGKDFLRSLLRGATIERANQNRDLTLGGWFDWLVEHDWSETLDDKTIASRQSRFDRYVREVLGNVPLKSVDPLIVRRFYKKLKADGVGDATVHAIKANLVRVFNQAISPYARVPMTTANPFRLSLTSLPARDAVALTPAQAIAALSCESLTDTERAMLGLYLLAGLRLSEQMALTCGQLLFSQSLLYVDRSVKIDKVGHQTIGLPKGNKKRLAIMCPTLKHLLCAVASDLPSDAYLWSTVSGNTPKMKKRTYDTWKEIVKKTELPPDMSPHDCRLTHINWIEKLLPDVSSTTLKEHVGHAASGVTEANYTRPLTPAQDILRSGLESLINPKQARRKKGRTQLSSPRTVSSPREGG